MLASGRRLSVLSWETRPDLMLSREAARPRPDPDVPDGQDGGERPAGPWWRGAVLFGSVAAVLWVLSWVSVSHLSFSTTYPGERFLPHQPWLDGWARWDSGWYREIAENGYSLVTGRQSSVAFFPAYPVSMRVLGAVLGGPLQAGILLTLAAGLTVAVAAWTWFGRRLSPAAAWTALCLLLLYPYAFYLYGVVYADALFIAAVAGAFLLLDADRPWLAGVAGALATAARPIGIVVVAALTVRAVERRGVIPWSPARFASAPAGSAGRAWWRDAGVLVAVAGLMGYCLYLSRRFGDPFAFATVEEYWGQRPGPVTWLKLDFFKGITEFGDPTAWVAYVAHAVVTFAALAFVPRVFRRFGWGYGVYSLLVVGLAAFSTKDFFGMGRYVLAAFPCFAAAAEVLVDHPRMRTLALVVSGVGLVTMTSFFARGSYLS